MFGFLLTLLIFDAFGDAICLIGLIFLAILILIGVVFGLYYFWPILLVVGVLYALKMHSEKDKKIANNLKNTRELKRNA